MNVLSDTEPYGQTPWSVEPDNPGPSDDAAGGAWMTKTELARARRISIASVDRLIRRKGWRRQPGNDGRVRVLVPSDALLTCRGSATSSTAAMTNIELLVFVMPGVVVALTEIGAWLVSC
jgi:hypothetical protein